MQRRCYWLLHVSAVPGEARSCVLVHYLSTPSATAGIDVQPGVYADIGAVQRPVLRAMATPADVIHASALHTIGRGVQQADRVRPPSRSPRASGSRISGRGGERAMQLQPASPPATAQLGRAPSPAAAPRHTMSGLSRSSQGHPAMSVEASAATYGGGAMATGAESSGNMAWINRDLELLAVGNNPSPLSEGEHLAYSMEVSGSSWDSMDLSRSFPTLFPAAASSQQSCDWRGSSAGAAVHGPNHMLAAWANLARLRQPRAAWCSGPAGMPHGQFSQQQQQASPLQLSSGPAWRVGSMTHTPALVATQAASDRWSAPATMVSHHQWRAAADPGLTTGPLGPLAAPTHHWQAPFTIYPQSL